MRADRLVSEVLLLRRHGRMTAPALARELAVSTRTVLRDMDALSAAGVPVYAERGRHGGFCLLPGFRTQLAGLTHDEALALLATGARNSGAFGLGPALASATRKLVDALPDRSRDVVSDAAERFLVDPETDLLSRRHPTEHVPPATMTAVRRAVLAGSKLRLEYQATGQEPTSRTVDPIGLVTVRGRGYLLATRSGEDRTYRLSRIVSAEVLEEPAERPTRVDLDRLWTERGATFLTDDHVSVHVRVTPERRDDLLDMVEAAVAENPDPDGWLRLVVTFQDLRHAQWALWQLGVSAEALSPPELRAFLHARSARLAGRYRDPVRARDGGGGLDPAPAD